MVSCGMDSNLTTLKRLMLSNSEISSSCLSIYYHVECEQWLKDELLPVVQGVGPVRWKFVKEKVLTDKITPSVKEFNGVTLVVISAACIDDDEFWQLVEVARHALKDALILVTYNISQNVLLATPGFIKVNSEYHQSLLANGASNFTVELKHVLFKLVQKPQKHEDAASEYDWQTDGALYKSRRRHRLRLPRIVKVPPALPLSPPRTCASSRNAQIKNLAVHSFLPEPSIPLARFTATRRPIVLLLKIVYEENNTNNKQVRQRQVFIYYHDDDYDWVRDVLIVYLRETLKMSIITEEQFELGSVWIEEILQVIETSEFTIVVLSTSYIKDGKCCQVTVRAYNIRPHGLIPVALRGVTEEILSDKDGIFRVIVETYGLIRWSDNKNEQDMFWTELTSRLNNDQTVVETLSEVVEAVGTCMTASQHITAYDRKSDVFIHYHNDDFDWVHDVLTTFVTKTLRLTVRTEDQFNYGSCRETEILQSVLTSEFTIVVCSISSISDLKYSALTAEAFAVRPLNVVLVATPGVTAEDLKRNSFLSELSKHMKLIQWSEKKRKQASFWSELTKLLGKSRQKSKKKSFCLIT